MDGHDYFQWAQTDDCTNGTGGGDTRGPYATICWNETCDQAEGVEYGAKRYFSQPVFNGAWTLDGLCDIPFCREWGEGLEIGYVATQHFTQQLAGCPGPAASDGLPTSGSTITWDEIPSLDYQMCYYDNWLKITWGLPYGYMMGLRQAGCKNRWGQYSLSIVLDSRTEDGVMRVRDENRIIHAGKVAMGATTGAVRTTGSVGTMNPALQTLSPSGYDHNFRTWWAEANGGTVDLTFDVAGSGGDTVTALQNPTFRIAYLASAPTSVSLNSQALTEGSGYYASYNDSLEEAWVTLVSELSGSNTIHIEGEPSAGVRRMHDYRAARYVMTERAGMLETAVYAASGRMVLRRTEDVGRGQRVKTARTLVCDEPSLVTGTYVVRMRGAGIDACTKVVK
jgi:hypothetical protein